MIGRGRVRIFCGLGGKTSLFFIEVFRIIKCLLLRCLFSVKLFT